MTEEQEKQMYSEKAAFVRDKLLPLLQAIDSSIEGASHHVLSRRPYDLEYILISWSNAESQRIYVTGDSLLAISRDVLRSLR